MHRRRSAVHRRRSLWRHDMPHEFAGRVALVTGATSGIGKALALAFARGGGSLGITARRAELLEETAEELRAAGAKVATIAGDQRKESHANEAVAKTVKELGGLDVLVNNAGVIGSGPLETTTTAGGERIFDQDLKGPFLFCRA